MTTTRKHLERVIDQQIEAACAFATSDQARAAHCRAILAAVDDWAAGQVAVAVTPPAVVMPDRISRRSLRQFRQRLARALDTTHRRHQMSTTERAVPVLYLDLDGTVRQGMDDALGRFVNGPEDVVVFPEAVEMMRRWKAGGGRIIGVSNQGGVALGIVGAGRVAAAMAETHLQADKLFDKIAWCSHHPSARHPEWARCWCRKPSPGLIIEASLDIAAKHNEYYPPYMGLMVGDRPEDEQCAKLAGLDFQWAADWRARAADTTGGSP